MNNFFCKILKCDITLFQTWYIKVIVGADEISNAADFIVAAAAIFY